jgi:biotin transport system ATP-binding protein
MSERSILGTITALPREFTLIVITHRVEILAGFDRILVLHEGRLLADGSDSELNELVEVYWGLKN